MVGPPALTGRAEELNIIADVLCGYDGHAGMAIAGRAGVGKTRLAREALAADAELGWVVRSVVGTVAARSIPLGAFAQWTDRLDGDPLQLVGGVIATVTTSRGGAPVLVAVDDAHLLDSMSAFVVHQLALRGAATVITTIRTGEPAPDAVTTLWKDGHLRRLDLQPLSRPQSDAVLASALGGPASPECAERMWRLTRGNVLFLGQLVNQEREAGRLIASGGQWQWSGPMALSPSLVDVVEHHIGAARAAVREVMDLVAVAEPLELAYLTSLAEPEAIEESERRGLIAVSGTSPNDVVSIGHPLYGEGRVAQAGRVRLARLRGRVARVMASPDSRLGPPDPVRLGVLWLDSDLPPDPDVFNRAARAALLRLDLALANRLAEAAAAAGAGVEAELLHAHTLSLSGRAEEAERLLAALTGGHLPDPIWTIAVHLRAANMLWSLAQPEQSWNLIDDALAAPAGDTAQLIAFRAVQLAAGARPAEVLRTCECIDRLGLRPLPALKSAWALTIALGDLGRPREAAAVADEGAAVAATSPDAAYQAVPLAVFQVRALVLGGHITQALDLAERTDQRCTDMPGITQTVATAITGMVALANGDLHTAVERLRSAVTACELDTTTAGLTYYFLILWTEALARAGAIATALQALTRMRRSRHPSVAFVESDSLLSTAWVAAASGRTSEARTLAARAAEFARTHGQHAPELSCLQTALQFGDKHHARRLTELASLVKEPRADLAARWAVAVADENGDALLGVSGDLEAMGDRVAAADAAAHASLAFHRSSRRGPALTAGGRASRLISECGASTPATRAAAAPLPLTSREREIATLVAGGLSNKEIAESLMVSVRTVEGHIYRACSTLGIASRTELAGLISQSGATNGHRVGTAGNGHQPHRGAFSHPSEPTSRAL